MFPDSEADDFQSKPGRLRTILGRAVGVYLGLFLGSSLVMSILGLDPLLHNGALPQCLLVIVGLALILALAGGETNLIDEQVRSRLILFNRRPLPEGSLQKDHAYNAHRW
ncbi:MAG: hypothetical protein HS126_27325 [Anaerolineales bacterium]|nr:hypothetical protein [Anaerolineales bacterium]